MSREFEFDYNLTRIASTAYEDLCIFMIISRLIHLRMKSKQTFYVQHISYESATFMRYEKNMVEPQRSQITIKC